MRQPTASRPCHLASALVLVVLVVLGACQGPESPPENLFLPEDQTPFMKSGLIVPDSSLPCTPVDTGVPQTDCNHHGSSVTVLPDGTVAATWFFGVEEKSPDSHILWSRFDGASWSAPTVLFDDPERAEGNSALWIDSDGALKLFFVSIYGDGWPSARVRTIRSTDGGETWSAPEILYDDGCMMARHRPVRLSSGEALLPVYNECLGLPDFFRSSDDFEKDVTAELLSFESADYVLAHVGQIQPALIRREDGTIFGITRSGTAINRIHGMTSENGWDWTESAPLDLPNPGASVDMVRLKDGHVVVLFNNSPTERYPLAAALSVDEGRTFTAIRNLIDCEACDEFSYPSVTQSLVDGTIWVTFTHNRETIGWFHFNEAWLAEGGDVAVLD